MHSRTGVITSPNYPSAYGTDAECEWEIRVDPGYKVIADFFQRFDLENSTNCQNDFVQVCQFTFHSSDPVNAVFNSIKFVMVIS